MSTLDFIYQNFTFQNIGIMALCTLIVVIIFAKKFKIKDD